MPLKCLILFWLAETGLRIRLPFCHNEWLYKLLKPYVDRESSVRHAINQLVAGGKVEKVERNGKVYFTLRDSQEFRPREKWDGTWLQVIFDVSEKKRIVRDQLRGRLRKAGFRQWQRSVWLRPKVKEVLGVVLSSVKSQTGVSIIISEITKIHGVDEKRLASQLWELDRLNQEYCLLAQRGQKVVGLLNGTLNRRQRESLWQDGQEVLVETVATILSDPRLPERLLSHPWYGNKARHNLEGLIEVLCSRR